MIVYLAQNSSSLLIFFFFFQLICFFEQKIKMNWNIQCFCGMVHVNLSKLFYSEVKYVIFIKNDMQNLN